MKLFLKISLLLFITLLSFFLSGCFFILLIYFNETYFQEYYLLYIVVRAILHGYLAVATIIFILGIILGIYIFGIIDDIEFDKY